MCLKELGTWGLNIDSSMRTPILRGEIKQEVGRGSGLALLGEKLAKSDP